jgi:hypothetical protein
MSSIRELPPSAAPAPTHAPSPEAALEAARAVLADLTRDFGALRANIDECEAAFYAVAHQHGHPLALTLPPEVLAAVAAGPSYAQFLDARRRFLATRERAQNVSDDHHDEIRQAAARAFTAALSAIQQRLPLPTHTSQRVAGPVLAAVQRDLPELAGWYGQEALWRVVLEGVRGRGYTP